MKKMILLISALLLLVSLCSCGGAFRNAGVLEAVGSVTLLRDSAESEVPCDDKTALSDGDAVHTGAASSAWLRLDEDKTILLDEYSELGLSGGNSGFTLELGRGTLLARVDRPLRAEETFDIAVGNALLGVRGSGTVYSLDLSGTGGAALCVYQGRVAIADRSGSETLTLEKGQSVRFDLERGTLIGEAGPIDYAALSDLIAENVADYAREAMAQAVEGDRTEPSAETAPEPEPTDAPPESTDVASKPLETPTTSQNSGVVTGSPPAPIRYAVIFDLDGGRIGDATGSILTEVESGQGVTPPQGVVKDGAVLLGWVVERGGDMPAQLGKITGNMTVYAQWKELAPVTPSTTPNQPKITFSYQWDGTAFQPCADIVWVSGCENAYLKWQVYDGDGNARPSSGRIDGAAGTVNLHQKPLTLSHPSGTGLYPVGYTIRLTPYCMVDGTETELDAVDMALPYLEAEWNDGMPIITTNIGLYFHHAYDSLAVAQEDGRLHVTGQLLPLSGEDMPLLVDIQFQ